MSARLSIGLVTRRTGATVPTVRYQEEVGLLPPASRTASGQRSYDESTLRRLVFIRRCRDFGFSIDQVRELVGLVDEPERPCVEVRNIAASHLQQVRRKLDELRAFETSLNTIVCSCETACAGCAAVDCTKLEDLAGPAENPRTASGTGCCTPRQPGRRSPVGGLAASFRRSRTSPPRQPPSAPSPPRTEVLAPGSKFAKGYLHTLVTEVRISAAGATMKGSNAEMAGAISGWRQGNPDLAVPRHVSNWRTRPG